MAEKGNDILITRIFDAPREVVWKAWTDPEHVKRWWGPKNFTAPFVKSDFRVGGKYLYCMRSADGKEYWSTGVYREIVPQQKIVATDSFADEKGNIVQAAHYGMSPDLPLEFLITVTFEPQGNKTKFTLRHAGMPEDMGKMAEHGWNESLDKLAESLR
ncbi:SRPBCC domain-containing protein [bacterium]|nr:SRPBCC domain-containing protein [bacterium]MCI0614868.1 SRPBCC domain-containing protein [bacterium]